MPQLFGWLRLAPIPPIFLLPLKQFHFPKSTLHDFGDRLQVLELFPGLLCNSRLHFRSRLLGAELVDLSYLTTYIVVRAFKLNSDLCPFK